MSDHFPLVLCLPLVDSVGMEEQERERRRQVVEKFQKAPFEEIAAHCGARVQQILSLVLEFSYSSSKIIFLNSIIVFFASSRPHYCRANSTKSLRLQSGDKFCFRQLCNILCSTINENEIMEKCAWK